MSEETTSASREWGLLPDAVHRRLAQSEWSNQTNLKRRLLGERTFPISVSLKAPSERQALDNLQHFQQFVTDWQNFAPSDLVHWEPRRYRSLKTQQLPVRLVLSDMQALLNYLGGDAVKRSQRWEERMTPLMAIDPDFYPVLVKHLTGLEALPLADVLLLAELLPQMKAGLGGGGYLRALPVTRVDTKFVESNTTIIADLLDVAHNGAVTALGGLEKWLDCRQTPVGWLYVRPLSNAGREALGGFTILQLPVTELLERPLPSNRILVIENLQSGLAVPEIEDTIVVCGGGRNVSWLAAPWLAHKQIAYWGDIDTWGLAILGEARALRPNIVSLMMEQVTVLTFQQRMVAEPEKFASVPAHLNADEQRLFIDLKTDKFGLGRLEQERLPGDYVHQQLQRWLQQA